MTQSKIILTGYWNASRKKEKFAKNSKRKYGGKNEDIEEVSSVDRHETEMMIEKGDKFMDRSKIDLRNCRPPISILIKKKHYLTREFKFVTYKRELSVTCSFYTLVQMLHATP